MVIEGDMRRICEEMDIGIEIDLWMDEAPVPMDKKTGRPTHRPVRKGEGEFPRDAQRRGTRRANFRPCFPTCMIFMPSIKGISHNPAKVRISRIWRKGKNARLNVASTGWTE